jgi:hypothetical protein
VPGWQAGLVAGRCRCWCGAGEQGGDDAGCGVGDGGPDGCLVLAGAVQALDVQSRVQGLADDIGCVEQVAGAYGSSPSRDRSFPDSRPVPCRGTARPVLVTVPGGEHRPAHPCTRLAGPGAGRVRRRGPPAGRPGVQPARPAPGCASPDASATRRSPCRAAWRLAVLAVRFADPPCADRVDADRRAPALRHNRPAAARLARRRAACPVDHVARAGQRPRARRRPASHIPGVPVPVPAGQHTPRPAETPPNVAPWDTIALQATPAVPAADAGALIAGIAGAASFLGYDKPDSFRRPHPPPHPRRNQDTRRPHRLDTRRPPRRQPHLRRPAGLGGMPEPESRRSP